MTNPYAPPSATVYDVTDGTATMVPADRLARLGASILDGIVIGVLVYLPFFAGFGISAAMSPGDLSSDAGLAPVPLLVGVFLGLIGFGVWAVFTIRYVTQNGQSIAKRWLNIKVVRTDGSPATLGRIFWLRNVVNSLIGAIPFVGVVYGIVDLLFIFSESRQCLHDKLADTIVVNA
jgi:uncharacterized RDD family membrane protein YckC